MWSLDRKDHKIHSVEERGDAKSQCVLKFGMEIFPLADQGMDPATRLWSG